MIVKAIAYWTHLRLQFGEESHLFLLQFHLLTGQLPQLSYTVSLHLNAYNMYPLLYIKIYTWCCGSGSARIRNFLLIQIRNNLTSSVVDPNRLCSDPDPGSHVHPDTNPDNPNKFGSGFNLNFTNFLNIKGLTVFKMIFFVLKFSFK